MSGKIAVIGAGIIGVCSALDLIQRGYDVTLIDKNDPGKETSFGNAGVIARSSLVPFNHPGIWKSLPGLLKNKSTAFRYNPFFIAANSNWATAFLKRANNKDFRVTADALDSLIQLSTKKHIETAELLGLSNRLSNKGWLYLYKSEDNFDRAQKIRDAFNDYKVSTEILDTRKIKELEPDLKADFSKGLWIQDALSVSDPGDLVSAYAKHFHELGGKLIKSRVKAIISKENGYNLQLEHDQIHQAGQVVLALGPWSKDFMKDLGYSTPLVFERGYHMNYSVSPEHHLNRPVYDVDGGYVLAPMSKGIRLTTGVELARRDAPPNYDQLKKATNTAKAAFPLHKPLDKEPWLGSRPTLPDCRPIIGKAPRHKGLWLAFGHQHIGFSTGPGTASVLGALISGEVPPIDANPFRAERFIS